MTTRRALAGFAAAVVAAVMVAGGPSHVSAQKREPMPPVGSE